MQAQFDGGPPELRATIPFHPASESHRQSLAFALRYAEQGFRVLPIHSIVDGACTCDRESCHSPGKHPWTKHGVKDATCEQETIRAWWALHPCANVGIATGGDLAVIDVDPRNGGDETLAELEARLGPLPREFVANTGGGGRHFFMRVTAHRRIGCRKPWGDVGGIDVKANGGYVVAPPSLHVSGGKYELAAEGINLPTMPSAWLEAITDGASAVAGDRPATDPEGIWGSASLSPFRRKSWSDDTLKRIRVIIRREAVTMRGFRNDHQISLVQQLDRIPEIRNCPATALRPFIAEWFANSETGTPWDEVWKLFVYQWDKWRNRLYCDPAELAFRAAMSKPYPPAAGKYRSKNMRKLVALCGQMQATCADDRGIWFLSCRKAADVLGVDFQWANKNLNRLCEDGVIEKAEEHLSGSMWSQRYRYVGEDVHSAAA